MLLTARMNAAHSSIMLHPHKCRTAVLCIRRKSIGRIIVEGTRRLSAFASHGYRLPALLSAAADGRGDGDGEALVRTHLDDTGARRIHS